MNKLFLTAIIFQGINLILTFMGLIVIEADIVDFLFFFISLIPQLIINIILIRKIGV